MFLKYNKWAMLWALLIFVLCAIPGKDLPKVSWLDIIGIDKFIHAFLFFVQVVLLIKGFKGQIRFEYLKNNSFYMAIFICVVYGAMLEAMQGAFYNDRTADVYDFAANSFGTFFGAIFFRQAIK